MACFSRLSCGVIIGTHVADPASMLGNHALRIAGVVAFLRFISGCGGAEFDKTADDTDDAVSAAAGTVEASVRGKCSTSMVRGLSEQLVGEILCIEPGSLARIDDLPGVTLEDEVFPYLQKSAALALGRAAKASKQPLVVTSALRTSPQQYLLRRWFETGRCSIPRAASVGGSNHEEGLALDVSGGRSLALVTEGFRWFGKADAVHHDFEKGADLSLEGLSTTAFQRLWNRNHPKDRLPEDGKYDKSTELRLKQAPADGFPVGPSCGAKGPAPGAP